jgi:hypothetical protein
MTSEPTIICISTSMNGKEPSTACPRASDRAHSGSLKKPNRNAAGISRSKDYEERFGVFRLD